MCTTITPAKLSETILLANSIETEDRTINVVGYQNEAFSDGPNGMIIPFPSVNPMSQENCIDMTGYHSLFRNYVKLITPVSRVSRSLSKGIAASAPPPVRVFESGSYTVVLAVSAKYIPDAIKQVPIEKRPPLNQSLFEAFENWYKTEEVNWPVALCCWKGSIKPEPLLWWYDPLPAFRDFHFLPGLDGHDGKVPNLEEKVLVDTTVIVSSETGVSAEHLMNQIPDTISRFLPTKVQGRVFHKGTKLINGDWILPKKDWTYQNEIERFNQPRVKPPGSL